jgi:multiphosphoryl transfer protein
MSTNLTLTCKFRNGIHARPASFLAEFNQTLSSDIQISNKKNNNFYNGKSAISIVSSNILYNEDFVLTIDGEKENDEVKKLEKYIEGDWLLCDEDKYQASAIITDGYIPKIFSDSLQQYIQGKPVVNGIACAQLLNVPKFTLTKDYLKSVKKGTIDEERRKFDLAREYAISKLKENLNKSDNNERDLIKFQIQFVGDEEFRVKTYSFIHAGYSAIESINSVVNYYSSQFRESQSEYIKQRDIDIIDIGYNLMTHIDKDILPLFRAKIEKECILACDTLTPSQFIALDKSLIKGLIISHVGETSHTVILAKAYGIPTLINVDYTMLQSLFGSEVILDAHLGLCVFSLSDRVQHYYSTEQLTYKKIHQLNEYYIHGEVFTSDQVRVEVAANIINEEECENAFKNGAESIGLFRTEMMYIDSDSCPDKIEIAAQIKSVLSHAVGKSIIIRTLDIGGDKPAKYINFNRESNPFLGYRGIRIYKDNYEIFHDLISSIISENKDNNIKIMVPMVSCLEEVIWFRESVDKIKSELKIFTNIELGIMIEVPSITYNLEACCEYVDFFSIGSNDLMQYFMAADRENNSVKNLYNKYNPSFIRLVNNIIKTVKSKGKWIGICGELASDQNFIKLLIGMGIDELSMGVSMIPTSRRTIFGLNAEKCTKLVSDILPINLSDDVEFMVSNVSCEQIEHKIISQDNIFTDVSFIDKDDAIKYMVDNLYINNFIKNKYLVESDIWNRESTYSTDIGFGFAIPHAKSKNIDKTAISVCKLKSPIIWGKQEVNFIIMLTIQEGNSNDNQHMKIFSLLARKIMNSEFREYLLACQTSAEITSLMADSLNIKN